MLDKLSQQAGASLTQAMETVAFIVPEPAQRPSPGPRQAVLVSMSFTGPVCGVVEMVAAQEVGAALADNVVAGDDNTAPDQRGNDALKELLNMTCGTLLCEAGEAEGEIFNIALPQLSVFNSGADWPAFIATPGARVFDADGALIAIRVKLAA